MNFQNWFIDIHQAWSKVTIGASLSEPHTSGTALRTCVCMSVCLQVCLRPYTVNSKYLTKSSCIGEGYSQSAALVTWSEDNWSWSTHSTLIVVCTATNLQQQAAHNGVNYGWCLKSLRVKSVHKWHSYTPQTQLMISAWSLVRVNVATVAALAGETTGICIKHLSPPLALSCIIFMIMYICGEWMCM